MDGAGGFQGVLLDKGDGGDSCRLSCFCDSDQGLFLPIVELAQLAGEAMGLFLQEGVQDEEDVVFVDGFLRGDGCKDVVHQVVDIVGVALEEVVGEFGGSEEDFPTGFPELRADERHVFFLVDPTQIHLFHGVIEGSCRRMEHVLEDVPTAAGEDEPAVVHGLDMGAEERLHILFRITVDLLELVDGEDAGAVGLLQVGEDLPEGQFRGVDVTELDVEGRPSRERVVAETAGQ